MPPAIASLTTRLSTATGVTRGRAARWGLLVALHLVALGVLYTTESRAVPQAAFVLTWALLNFVLLAFVRRPAVAAALSLAFIAGLISLSLFKHDVLLMTVNFVDLMIIDADTFTFLMKIFPQLGTKVAVVCTLGLAALMAIWYFDPLRVRRRHALAGAAVSLVALAGLALAVPSDPWDEFYSENYVSKFARSGVTAVNDLLTRGILESDETVTGRLADAGAAATCKVEKPPHIIMVFDESSFDARQIPGV
jgi:hypothetical protein